MLHQMREIIENENEFHSESSNQLSSLQIPKTTDSIDDDNNSNNGEKVTVNLAIENVSYFFFARSFEREILPFLDFQKGNQRIKLRIDNEDGENVDDEDEYDLKETQLFINNQPADDDSGENSPDEEEGF